jgi:probable addiction module antidote protein
LSRAPDSTARKDFSRVSTPRSDDDRVNPGRDIYNAKRTAKEWTETRTMTKTGERFAPYDSADYLVDIEAAAAFLEAALEEADDDPAYIAQALGTIARSGNVSELARRVGMSREGLYKALSADGNPSFATIIKVAKALGLKLHFEPAA